MHDPLVIRTAIDLASSSTYVISKVERGQRANRHTAAVSQLTGTTSTGGQAELETSAVSGGACLEVCT
jgi:hypothetical protein